MKHTNGTSPLPPSYDENTLVALVQGPGVVYVYWELSPEFWDLLTTGGKYALRLYEVGSDGVVLLEEVSPERRTGNWYFRGVNDGVEYRCELGRWENSSYYSYLSSEVVATPSEDMAGPPEGAALRAEDVAAPVGNVTGTAKRLRSRGAAPFMVPRKEDQAGSSGFGPEGEG